MVKSSNSPVSSISKNALSKNFMANQFTDKSNFVEITKKRLQSTSKINENGCWIWQGYLCEPRKLYGLTSITINGPKRKILAHRASYILWKGDIPKNMFVLHSCDVPLCINPDHLHLGNAQLNMDEMKERGRKKPAKGEKNRHAKFSNEDIFKMRKLFEDGKNQSEIRKIFKCGRSTISYIINRKTWSHI